MNEQQVKRLRNFSVSEKLYGNRDPVPWEDFDRMTMEILDDLRDWWGRPIELIRGSHGEGKETAVDAVCPGITPEETILGLSRLPCHWGYYRGGSFHIDRRPLEGWLYRRWMAFKPVNKVLLDRNGLGHLVGPEKDGWLYAEWKSEESFRALEFLMNLNRAR